MAKELTLLKFQADKEARLEGTAKAEPFRQVEEKRTKRQAARQEEINPELLKEGPTMKDMVTAWKTIWENETYAEGEETRRCLALFNKAPLKGPY